MLTFMKFVLIFAAFLGFVAWASTDKILYLVPAVACCLTIIYVEYQQRKR